MKQFALLAGEQKHRHEGEDDDRHREEDRATDLRGGGQRLFKHLGRRQSAAAIPPPPVRSGG